MSLVLTCTLSPIICLQLHRKRSMLHQFSNGVANFFFSAAPGDTTPVVGGFRQNPTVYSEFNKDLQQEEYLTIAEWGFELYRPENLVTILTAATSVVTP